MYDEFVKRLRKQVECDKKLYPQGPPFETLLLDLAADAIEELSKKQSGEWIEEESGWDDVYYTCSVCGDAVCTIDGTTVEDNGWNYCPTCGIVVIGIKRLPEPPKEVE